VSGTAIFSPAGEYSGQNLLLRTLVESDYTIDDKLTGYQKSIVNYLMQICGDNEETEIKELLMDYYLAYLKQLYNFVYRTGGGHLGLLFLETLDKPPKSVNGSSSSIRKACQRMRSILSVYCRKSCLSCWKWPNASLPS
jgi:hypothetical protein